MAASTWPPSCSATSRAAAASRAWPRTDMLTTPTTRRRGRRRRPGSSSATTTCVVGRLTALAERRRHHRRRAGQRAHRPARVRPEVDRASPPTCATPRIASPTRVYEKIIGVRGAFATRIAYVSVDGKPPNQHYQLIVADADGENPRMILQSDRPLMSPAWSPDGEWLAYVSFERRVSAVYVQQRAHRQAQHGVGARRHQRRAGLVAGRQEAGAHAVGQQRQSRHLSTRSRHASSSTRLTDDPGIDTEAAFAPDGSAIYFTSDRSGSPQIYRLTLGSSERPQARHLHRRVQCAAARLAGRQAAGGADARRRRVPHRPAGSGQRHAARCCRRAARTNRRASRPTAPW